MKIIKPRTQENSGQPQVSECVTATVTWAGLTTWLASQCLSWAVVTWSFCSRVVYLRVTFCRSVFLFCVLHFLFFFVRGVLNQDNKEINEIYSFSYCLLVFDWLYIVLFSWFQLVFAYLRVALRIFFPLCSCSDIFPRDIVRWERRKKWKSSSIFYPLFPKIASSAKFFWW